MNTELIEQLREKFNVKLGKFPILEDARDLNDCVGLCNSKFVHVDSDILDIIFESWPDFSGNIGFPVSVDDSVSPVLQYDIAQYNDEMNKGEYGQKRLELYNYTAEILNAAFVNKEL
jgi:hypothetical protein